MTIKSTFCLVISLLLSGVIALAQQPPAPPVPSAPPAIAMVPDPPTPPAEPLDEEFALPQDPPTPPVEPLGQEFSFFFAGGSFLGVHAEDISRENMGRYGLREVRGAGITSVVKDSPAEKAGLRKDDVILRIDGENVTSTRNLTRLVSEIAPDQTVRVTFSRGGSEQEVSVTMGNRKDHMKAFGTWEGKAWPGEKFKIEGLEGLKELKGLGAAQDGFVFAFGGNRRIGVSTTTLTKQLADYFGVADGKGVLVTSVGEDSAAAKAGIRAGDVITAVDGEKIEDAGDLSRAINKKRDGDVSLTIVRDKSQRTFTVTPKEIKPPLIQPGTTQSARRVVIPRISLPSIPEMRIVVPAIELPTIPEIDVQIQKPGKVNVRVVRNPI